MQKKLKDFVDKIPIFEMDKYASVAESSVDYLRELLAQARPHNCDGLYHPKADQHGEGEPCPILARINLALDGVGE